MSAFYFFRVRKVACLTEIRCLFLLRYFQGPKSKFKYFQVLEKRKTKIRVFQGVYAPCKRRIECTRIVKKSLRINRRTNMRINRRIRSLQHFRSHPVHGPYGCSCSSTCVIHDGGNAKITCNEEAKVPKSIFGDKKYIMRGYAHHV